MNILVKVLTICCCFFLLFANSALAAKKGPTLDVGSYVLLEDGCYYEISDPSAVVKERRHDRPAYKFIKTGTFTIKHYHNGDMKSPPEIWIHDIVPEGQGFGFGKIEHKVETITRHVEGIKLYVDDDGMPVAIEKEEDYSARVLELVNIERQKVGVGPLKLTRELMDASAIRANELTELFSHTRPNGQSCQSLIQDGAYTVGENIAAGYMSPEEAVIGWMNSPGHRANILNPDYTELGVGYAYLSNDDYGHYWVQLFKRPMKAARRWY